MKDRKEQYDHIIGQIRYTPIQAYGSKKEFWDKVEKKEEQGKDVKLDEIKASCTYHKVRPVLVIGQLRNYHEYLVLPISTRKGPNNHQFNDGYFYPTGNAVHPDCNLGEEYCYIELENPQTVPCHSFTKNVACDFASLHPKEFRQILTMYSTSQAYVLQEAMNLTDQREKEAEQRKQKEQKTVRYVKQQYQSRQKFNGIDLSGWIHATQQEVEYPDGQTVKNQSQAVRQAKRHQPSRSSGQLAHQKKKNSERA